MKSSLAFSALAALVLAATPARAVPISFGAYIPNDLPLCSGGGETNDEPSWSSWVTSYGCMGAGGGSPKNYVMTFLPNNGSGFDCSVVWENQRSSCPSQVPDGGSTAVLLGGALAGFVALRRRFGRA